MTTPLDRLDAMADLLDGAIRERAADPYERQGQLAAQHRRDGVPHVTRELFRHRVTCPVCARPVGAETLTLWAPHGSAQTTALAVHQAREHGQALADGVVALLERVETPRLARDAATRAAPWPLLLWAALLGMSWVCLVFVLPPFEKLFAETGLALSWSTQALFAASSAARSAPGLLLGVLVLLVSVLAFVLARPARRRVVGRVLAAGSVAALASFALGFGALVLALVRLVSRL